MNRRESSQGGGVVWYPPAATVLYACGAGFDQPTPSVTITTTGTNDCCEDDAVTEADIVADVCHMALSGKLSERARKLLLVALERAEAVKP